MRITVTGGTGFIGRPLVEALRAKGHAVYLLGRNNWRLTEEPPPPASIDGAGAVIHLAGEPVAQRWTAAAKRRILDSRVIGTKRLVEGLARSARRPAALVCASAVGYYGDRGDEQLGEDAPPGSGFLPNVCAGWEEAADMAGAIGIRVVKLRTGVVLGPGGGALARMLLPFRLGLGGRIGSGRQWMSWIHLDDLVALIARASEDPRLRGAVNATAPAPVTNAQFTSELAAVLHRPALLPAPASLLKLAFGEMATVLISSQRALPRAAEAAGFEFRYRDLRPALEAAVLSS